MSEFMESTGKTVDEAIREALLRMGLRRDEVEVTVLQRDRGGVLGIGRRDAVVRVERKTGAKRGSGSGGGRGRDRSGGGERLDGGRERGSRGRRGGSSRRRDGDGDRKRDEQQARGRGRGRDQERKPQDDQDKRGGRGRGRGRQKDEEQVARQEEPRRDERRSDQAAGRGDSGEEGRSSRRRRSRRRRRKPAAEVESAVTNPVGDGKLFAEAEDQAPAQDERQEQPAATRERGGRRGGGERRDRDDRRQRSDERQERSAERQERSDDRQERADGRRERSDGRRERSDDRRDEQTRDDETTTATREAPAARVDPAMETPAMASDTLVGGQSAKARVAPFSEDDAASMPDFLERVATGLMVKAGFPSRVTVAEGEYHQVKLVVDDRSAGVLIGRHGNTVDAVEYLVEKIASHAAGDRVRMNLDINNYRLRRHDSLEQRARNAGAEALNTGEPVCMDPMNARERRIVHLEIQEMDDLTTYTEDGMNGKYVVICREDQVPGDDGPDQAGSAVAAESVAEPEAVVAAAEDTAETVDDPDATDILERPAAAPEDDEPAGQAAAVLTDDDDLDDLENEDVDDDGRRERDA